MEITVYVFKRDGRKNYECQWNDPVTGQTKMKSTRTPNRRLADQFAGELRAKLEAGTEINPIKTEWIVLADRYESEYLSGKAKRTLFKFRAIRKHVEKIINPKFVQVLTSSKLSEFQGILRNNGMEEATIKTSLSALRACLNWGKTVDLVKSVPVFVMPTRTEKAKGRPLTDGEFKAMLGAADKVVEEYSESVKDLMLGLWFSALRIEEALRLTWEPTSDGFSLETDQKGIIRLRIESNADKSTAVRLLPLALDFQRFLQSTPAESRYGFVFNPHVRDQKTQRMRADTCSKLISRIGKEAKIQVALFRPKKGETEQRIKFASAHDLRRSFANRWTDTVSEDQLRELMRHRDGDTVRKYYAKKRAERVEQALNDAMQKNSDISSDIQPHRRSA